ncbi:MAG: ATP-dependent ligase [Verrucomicrobiales bacterium]|nr:ATP-dependent ligase [Verrucomicrobiales bacterium]
MADRQRRVVGSKISSGQRALIAGCPRALPSFIPPMSCKLVDRLPRGNNWTYEVKLDGFRALAIKRGETVSLVSRSKKDLSLRFPELLEEFAHILVDDIVLDGEIVAFNEDGAPSFEALQKAAQSRPPHRNLVFYAFDVLNLERRDLRGLNLQERRRLLEEVLPESSSLRISFSTQTNPELLVKEVRDNCLEGLVAKQLPSRYESGLRTGAWVKYKNLQGQEFVVGGFTSPEGNRKHFGALLVGYYQGGRLWYASRVGTGYSSKELQDLSRRMESLIVNECPFANVPEARTGRWGQGLTASEMKQCNWVKPELVVQVHFTEWTAGGHLRHPAYKGLREDKRAKEVLREVVPAH